MELTMPVGYRFVPTDEELIKHYLARKVFYKPLPAKAIQEIDASFFYGNPPDRLVEQYACDERDWFFFVYQDDFLRGQMNKMRTVENGVGFWRSIGGDQPIYNSEGDVLAFKIHFAYFFRVLSKWEENTLEDGRVPDEYSRPRGRRMDTGKDDEKKP